MISRWSKCPMKNSSLDIQTLADMTIMLSQNAEHQSTSDTAQHPRRKEISLVKLIALHHCQVL